jgi:suppressor of ftsI
VLAGLAVGLALPVLHEVIPHDGLHPGGAGAEAAIGAGAHHGAEASPGVSSAPAAFASSRSRTRRSNCPKHPPPFIRDSFPQPDFRRSRGGVLDTTLRAATGPTQINGEMYRSSVYEGTFPGPTLVFCPSDRVRIALRNFLDPAAFPNHHNPGVTNLHTHGLHVSPRSPQDNVYLEIPPGGGYDYRYKIPRDHRPGAYWYHPHYHGQTSPQTAAGMAGAMIVQGGLDERAAYRDIGQRLIVIQKTVLGNGVTLDPGVPGIPGPPSETPPRFLVNGYLNPEIPIQPGEVQRWSIVNATNGFTVQLNHQGQPFQLLARDGNYLPRRATRKQMVIPSGSRREVLVVGGPEGSTDLIAAPFVQFPGDQPPQETLATVVSRGAEVDEPLPPKRIEHVTDLRDVRVDRRHEIVYTQDLTKSPVEFYINGRQFDPDRVEEVMHLGEVEQWTVENNTDEWHSFHIHIQDFQVTKVNGKPVRGVYEADTMGIQPGGSFTMRTRPTNFTGKSVFHCHVLGHEDLGMMAPVRVKR